MTPLFRTPEPDERPPVGDMIVAALLFVGVLAMLYLVDLLKGVAP